MTTVYVSFRLGWQKPEHVRLALDAYPHDTESGKLVQTNTAVGVDTQNRFVNECNRDVTTVTTLETISIVFRAYESIQYH